MTLLWNNRSQFSWTSISEGCSLKVKCWAHGRGVWEQQLLSGLRFLKVQPFSSQVNWSWGQEGSWEEQLMKTKLVNAEKVRKGHCWTTLTIQDTNDRRINWKIFFFCHAPSHLTGTMRKALWPHCTQWCWRSTQPWPLLFPLSRFSSVITRPYYYLNL